MVAWMALITGPLMYIILAVLAIFGIQTFGGIMGMILNYWWLFALGIGSWVFVNYMGWRKAKDVEFYKYLQYRMLLKRATERRKD